jgi:curved DNA-binding protein CbpA
VEYVWWCCLGICGMLPQKALCFSSVWALRANLVMQELQDDYYAILGVAEDCAPDDVRKAYLKLAKKLHPDRFPNDQEKRKAAQVEFAKVTRAHEVLSDTKQRDEYDALRSLAKTRAALDAGVPGASSPSGGPSAPGSAAASASADQKQDREAWAAKHFQRAQESYNKKKIQEAQTAIQEAIRLVPTKPAYHCHLAEIYIARGWKTLAATEVQAALRLEPKNADAKGLEMKLKAASKTAGFKKQAPGGGGGGGSFLDQLKQLLGKKS